MGKFLFINSLRSKLQKHFDKLVPRSVARSLQILLKVPLFILAVPSVVLIRLVRPLILVRVGGLVSFRIGHFAGNTELYCCERDVGINVPKERHIDLFFMIKPVCNRQLAIMWKRKLNILPSWILAPIARVNHLIPGADKHNIGSNTQHDRDVHNLLDRIGPNLSFSSAEEAFGQTGLEAIGIPPGSEFICLNVRDSAYLNEHQVGDWSYHNYRDSNIQDYILTAEAMANRGYYVVRMGAKVHNSIASTHPKVIDYAANGMRTDFMDIYLGAKCLFCISTSSGFDAIPTIFRRPIVFVNSLPIGYSSTFCYKYISITKHHFNTQLDRLMSLAEIFSSGSGFLLSAADYKSKGIKLIDNTPEEILDVVVEMEERLKGNWQTTDYDEVLQKKFWTIFSIYAVDNYNQTALHGEIHARFGTAFLRNNFVELLG